MTNKSKPAKTGSGTNPLLTTWRTPHEVPPFEKLRPMHFPQAFDAALTKHHDEIAKIAESKSKPTFDNTIVAMETAGKLLNRVAMTFFNLSGADTNPELQKIEREIAPKLSEHSSAIMLNADLFNRVNDLHQRRKDLGLDAEQARLLERYHRRFVRAGATLDKKQKKRIAEIDKRLSQLHTSFSQNVLTDEQSYKLVLEDERDLAGLPASIRAAAAQAAKDAGIPGKHLVTLARSSVESFLKFSARRDLREDAFKAWIKRGENGGATDNRKVVAEIVALRNERASLLGFDTYAAYRLDDTMAKTPKAVRRLLDDVWARAVKRAGEERDALQKVIDKEGGNFQLAAWDWRYYAEKLRKSRYDLDEGEIKPYLQLDRIIAAAFDTAKRLFGVRFAERPDLPRYHPDVRAWEVSDARGRLVGIFYGDYFARPSKRSGAWMSGFRGQHMLGDGQRPVVVNVMNFAKGAAGEPSLLSLDDARTLFHEFGHGLHGLLSQVTYPSLAGTAVSRDFVELPSQLYEHWLLEPKVLGKFARHYETGKPMPKALLDRIETARNFNQGFATVEYVACALVDMEIHALKSADDLDITAFEKKILKKLGMPKEIAMRHRLPHFSHLFSGGGYAAGYYSYMWSEVMDADAFAAFEEVGNVFDAQMARRLKDYIYSAGDKQDPSDAYVAFRGRMPTAEAMLEKRGLA